MQGSAVVAIAALVIAGGEASADPVAAAPAVGRGAFAGDAAVLAELTALGVADAEGTFSPELGALEQGPLLSRLRLGAVARSGAWAGVVRADVAAALRAHVDPGDESGLAVAGSIVDDAYLAWRPKRWAGVALGRHEVPFSRFRQVDDMLLTGPRVPAAIDRITPDRRWGLGFAGDLGAIGYAGGVYADGWRVEPLVDADPSRRARMATALHGEWTPRAPIDAGFLPTPRSDPWFDTWRISLGAGALYRMRDGGDRIDLSASVQNKWRALASVAELVVSRDAGETTVAAAGEVSVSPRDGVAVFARGDLASGSSWTAGGGAALLLGSAHRTRLGVHGWLGGDDGDRRRGVVAELRLAL